MDSVLARFFGESMWMLKTFMDRRYIHNSLWYHTASLSSGTYPCEWVNESAIKWWWQVRFSRCLNRRTRQGSIKLSQSTQPLLGKSQLQGGQLGIREVTTISTYSTLLLHVHWGATQPNLWDMLMAKVCVLSCVLVNLLKLNHSTALETNGLAERNKVLGRGLLSINLPLSLYKELN